MKYEAKVGDRTFEVEIDGEVVKIDGRLVSARVLAIAGSPLMRVSLDGISRTYAMSRGADGWDVLRNGRSWSVEVVDERARSLRQLVGRKARPHDGGVVRAPMPGLVLRVEVTAGQEVSAGAGLLVLEAMKMENEIRSGAGGTVTRILVQPGQKVEKGAELVEVMARRVDHPVSPG